MLTYADASVRVDVWVVLNFAVTTRVPAVTGAKLVHKACLLFYEVK